MKEKVKEYLLAHDDDELIEVVEEINSFNGELEFIRYYPNDEEFFDTFFKDNPTEAVRASFYGQYNYCDSWVKFDEYGNLESADGYTLVKELKYYIDEIVTELIKVYKEIEVSKELKEILED